jgi:hypothetical protein
MDGPLQGSEALENVPHRPILRGRLVEVIQSPSLTPWETRGSGLIELRHAPEGYSEDFLSYLTMKWPAN